MRFVATSSAIDAAVGISVHEDTRRHPPLLTISNAEQTRMILRLVLAPVVPASEDPEKLAEQDRAEMGVENRVGNKPEDRLLHRPLLLSRKLLADWMRSVTTTRLGSAEREKTAAALTSATWSNCRCKSWMRNATSSRKEDAGLGTYVAASTSRNQTPSGDNFQGRGILQ